MDYSKINKINTDGNGNIVLQDVNGQNITINYNDIESIGMILSKATNEQTLQLKQFIAAQNQEILVDIRKIQNQLDKQNTEEKIDEYTSGLDGFFKTLYQIKIDSAKERILKDYSMIRDYENLLILESDPQRKEWYKSQIKMMEERTNGEEEKLKNLK